MFKEPTSIMIEVEDMYGKTHLIDVAEISVISKTTKGCHLTLRDGETAMSVKQDYDKLISVLDQENILHVVSLEEFEEGE